MFFKFSAGFNDQRGVRKNYLSRTFMYGKGQNGVANINDLSKTDYLTEATFHYQKLFNNVHDVNFLLGSSYQEFINSGTILYAYDFFSDAIKYNKMSVGEGDPGIDSSASKTKMASYFTRLQYNFNRKYLFTFTMRADGSDKFGRNNRYGFFPSGAFAWRMIEEPFMKNQKVVSDLKLRVSLGQTGNANIGNSAYEFFDANGRNYYFGGKENTGVNISQLPNPDLKWETTTEVNFGIDYGFFNNRINGNVEVYYKQISDLLGWQPLSGNAILPGYPANMGKTESRGLEISLITANVVRPFIWNSTFSFTAYRDNWLEHSPDYVLKPYETEHDPLTAVYGFIPEGVIQAGETVDYMPQAKPGMMKIKNLSGLDANGKKDGTPDNTINEADMVLLGHNAPDFTIGFNNEFRYKGFELNFFLYGSDGAMRWPSVRYAYGTDFEILKIKTGNNFETSIKDRWTSDRQSSAMPSGFRNPYLLSGHYAHEKTGYIRMKNLSLAYDMNRLAKIKQIDTARLSFNVTNLFTLTNFSGIDPEVENHSAPYPLQRTYSIALNLGF
jgi:TonB-linked SusC/RagA family outer membrane protein